MGSAPVLAAPALNRLFAYAYPYRGKVNVYEYV